MNNLKISPEDIRAELGAFLSKPMSVGSGDLSTQQNLSATSLSTGGLSGAFIIKDQGNISLYSNNNILSIYLGF